MPQYRYNCEFKLPTNHVVKLDNMLARELEVSINELLKTHYFWTKRVSRNVLYNIKYNTEHDDTQRSVHPFFQNVISLITAQ